MRKKKESSGWLLSIVIGVIVAILLVIVVYPNLVGKKNQKDINNSFQDEIMTKTFVHHFSYEEMME